MHIPYEQMPKLVVSDWFLWIDGNHSPAWNMAADEALLKCAVEFDKPILRFYGWDRPSVSFGRSQVYPEGIPSEYTVVRRPTGGGVVWHDVDVTYTLAVPQSHVLAQLDILGSYRLIHEAIASHLNHETFLISEKDKTVNPRTMRCFTSPSQFDIMGMTGKLAGAAQYRRGSALLNQGSVMLSVVDGDRAALVDAIQCGFADRLKAVYHDWMPDADFLKAVERAIT